MSNKKKLNISKFIDIIKEYPVLYDRTGTLAQNNEEKNTAWKEVTKKMDSNDINYLKSKWRNLRDAYQKSIKNKRDLEEMGMLHKYYAYKHENQLNSFLYEHVLVELSGAGNRKRKGSRNLLSSNFEKTAKTEATILYSIHDDETETDAVEYLLETENNDEPYENEVFINSDLQSLEPGVEDKQMHEDKSTCYVEDQEQRTQQVDETIKPDIDVWLQSVKLAILNLTKINQARVKRDINAILSNYEIEQLQNDGLS